MSELGFRFRPFTNESVTTEWTSKSQTKGQSQTQTMHSRSRSVSGPAMYATKRAVEEEELQRAIDSETDANTEFNAAKLNANIRPRSTSLDRGGRRKKKTSKEEKARRRQVADQARRQRRRNAGLDSDTTQGEDSDPEHVTGHGNTRPMHGMFSGTGHKRSASANMLPTHPYANNGYSYAPYGQPQNPYSQRSPYSTDPYHGPSLFASTNPTMLDPEEMARRKLEHNPLPTLPRGHRSGFQTAQTQPPANSLPGGYAPPTREKSRSKHSKSASTGTLPAHVAPTYPPAPPVPPKSSKSRRDKDRDRDRDRGEERKRDKEKGRSRDRSGWDTAEQDLHGVPVLDARGIPIANALGHAHTHTHAHSHSQSVPTIPQRTPTSLNGVPIVNAQPQPQLERTSSRGNKWGTKIAGLFNRGRRGSHTSQAGFEGRYPAVDPLETGRHYSLDTGRPPLDSRYPTDAPSSAPPTKSTFSKLGFDRLRRPSHSSVRPDPGPSLSHPHTHEHPFGRASQERLGRSSHDQLGRPTPHASSDMLSYPPDTPHFAPPTPGQFPMPPTSMHPPPPGQVPVGIRIDKFNRIIDEADKEKDKGKGRVMGFRLGKGNEVVEGPVRVDAHRFEWDDGRARFGDGMRPLDGMRPGGMDGRRPSLDGHGRRPSLDGPEAYVSAPRQRSGSGSSHPPPPLLGTVGDKYGTLRGDVFGRDLGGPSRDPGLGRDPGGLGRDPHSRNGDPYAVGKDPFGLHPDAHRGEPGLPSLKSPAMTDFKSPGMPMRSPAKQPSWDGRDLVSPHTPAEPPLMTMPSPHPSGMPPPPPIFDSRSPGVNSMLSPHPPPSQGMFSPVPGSVLSEGLSQPQPMRYEAAGATPFMREREVNTPRAPSIATTVPRTLPRPRTADSTVINPDSPGSDQESPDVADVDMALAAQHREAFEWAEQDAQEKVKNRDPNARYIFNGFPIWVNWDLFTRLENGERREKHQPPLPRVRSTTAPEELQDIYDEWRSTRDKWVDRFWDPHWAEFMHEQGGPIQRELAAERMTPMGQALEAARVYQRENSELPLAKREFSRGYLWDMGYMHPDWRWIQQKPWRWTVEHENDERRATGRAPLPRFYAGMSADDWRDVRDVWHTTASKWAEKRKDLAWLERDRHEGVTPEQRLQLEQQFSKSRQQHKVIRKASGQRSREALTAEERDKIRHDTAMEALARKQEAFKHAQALGTPQISEAEANKRRLAQQALEELMRTPAASHARPESSIGHGSIRQGSTRIGGSNVGHGAQHMGYTDSDQYESSSSDDRPSLYPRPVNGFPPRPAQEPPFPDWIRPPKTSDPVPSTLGSMPGQNPSAPSISKAKKTGILKGILKRTLSMQRRENNSNAAPPPARGDSQKRTGGLAGMFGSRNEVSPAENPWAGAIRNTHPITIQPIRFDRAHPFSMTSPHGIEFEGKLYPSAIHLWHALRFLRRPVRRGRGRIAEENWHPELAEAIRQTAEPELMADQWANAGGIGKDGTIMRSLQRPDWEEVQMEKIDDVLALKFTQHPSLGQQLVSTHPAELLYMWDGPWGAGRDLKGPNNLGKAVMRCRERLLAAQRRL
ncbi:Serine/arginine repetitive matrix protein 2 [Mus musculus] [Rhizoctonia solani]|uniref:Serine/arginine repetitive matrix protein 2 [Mus musculus] n=1 Tax=Rhizoctonia solani TaxID=456999 RepID=A0A0K6FP46_9AGAM|nr:Serine/arginine repetitive matrix protein 2 [Mus musculus] [Rhizoctonia solani]